MAEQLASGGEGWIPRQGRMAAERMEVDEVGLKRTHGEQCARGKHLAKAHLELLHHLYQASAIPNPNRRVGTIAKTLGGVNSSGRVEANAEVVGGQGAASVRSPTRKMSARRMLGAELDDSRMSELPSIWNNLEHFLPVCLLLCLHDRPCPGSLVSCRCLRHPDSREKQHLEGMLALAQLDHKKACKTAFEEHHQATALEMELNDVKATLASTKRLLDVRKLELKEGAPSLPWLPRAPCSARMPRRSWTSSSRVCVKLRRIWQVAGAGPQPRGICQATQEVSCPHSSPLKVTHTDALPIGSGTSRAPWLQTPLPRAAVWLPSFTIRRCEWLDSNTNWQTTDVPSHDPQRVLRSQPPHCRGDTNNTQEGWRKKEEEGLVRDMLAGRTEDFKLDVIYERLARRLTVCVGSKTAIGRRTSARVHYSCWAIGFR